MPIPDYQSVMLPLLIVASDGKDHRMSEAVEVISGQFGLTEAERHEQIPSGTEKIYDRISWAKSYMKAAMLLEYPQRGLFRITERGRSVLAQKPAKIDLTLLRQFPEFVDYYDGKASDNLEPAGTATAAIADVTPTQLLESGFQQMRKEIQSQLLDQIKERSPQFLEQLVLRLLTRMGYSDPLPGSAKRVGGPGDQGIDVVIKRDPLGLDVLYVQAKRYTNGSIGRQDIQAFAGALPGATRGIFVTTSTFTKQAIDNAKQQDLAGKKIILIDGVELSRLMYEHGIGVSAEKSRTYEVKPVDPGFFVEDEAEFGSG